MGETGPLTKTMMVCGEGSEMNRFFELYKVCIYCDLPTKFSFIKETMNSLGDRTGELYKCNNCGEFYETFNPNLRMAVGRIRKQLFSD